MQVRLFKPSVGEEEMAAIRDVFERSWLGLGPKVADFEREWTRYIRSAASVAVNSGTAALHLALAAFGFERGSKVMVTGLTFVSSATCILYNGLTPVFIDVDPETLSMSVPDMARKRTNDCVAIVVVHFGGHPAPMDQIVEFARAHNLKVVEDCAHCAGGEYGGKKLGAWGDIGCFSFEEKKSMTTGDGGMLVANDPDLIEPLRAHRWVGIDKDTWKRAAGYTNTGAKDPNHWYYEVAVLGFKYNMNDLAAAIGLEQLKKLDDMNEKRRTLIGRYLDRMRDLSDVRPLLPYQLEASSYWLFGIRYQNRDGMILHLKANGVATGVHYMPLAEHPLLRAYRSDTPVIDAIWPTMITLPLFVDMTFEEVDYVTDCIASYRSTAAGQSSPKGD